MKYKNKTTGEIAQFGGIPDDKWTPANKTEINNDLLEKAKKAKKREINLQRDNNVNKPYKFVKNEKTYCLSRSIRNELAWLKFASKETAVPWITDENEIIEINKIEFKSISIDLGDRYTNEFIQARLRKNIVDTLTDITAVKNYDITQIYIIK